MGFWYLLLFQTDSYMQKEIWHINQPSICLEVKPFIMLVSMNWQTFCTHPVWKHFIFPNVMTLIYVVGRSSAMWQSLWTPRDWLLQCWVNLTWWSMAWRSHAGVSGWWIRRRNSADHMAQACFLLSQHDNTDPLSRGLLLSTIAINSRRQMAAHTQTSSLFSFFSVHFTQILYCAWQQRRTCA